MFIKIILQPKETVNLIMTLDPLPLPSRYFHIHVYIYIYIYIYIIYYIFTNKIKVIDNLTSA